MLEARLEGFEGFKLDDLAVMVVLEPFCACAIVFCG